MTLVTEAKTALSAEKTLASLLASLKANANASTATNGGFASLLAESNVSSAKNETERAARSSSETDNGAEDRSSSAAQTSDDAPLAKNAEQGAEEPKAAEKAKTESSRDEGESDAAQAAQTPEHSGEDVKETADTEATAESVVAGGEKKKEDDTLDEEMEALMAALLPLDGSVSKNNVTLDVTKGAAVQEQSAASPIAMDPTKNLTQTASSPAELDPATSSASDGLASDKDGSQSAQGLDALASALNQITSELSSMKESGNQQAKGLDLSTLTQQTESVDADLAQLAEGVTPKQTAGQDLKNFLSQSQSQDTQAQSSLGREASGAVGGSATQSTFAATAAAVSTAGTSTVAATGTVESSQTFGLIGGVKSAGSYDVASQLSATRVTKGGATGLPQAVEQVSVQLYKAVKDGADEITIQLRPAELGKIEVKLEFGADKTVTGTVVADNQATLTLLQKDSDSLQRALQEAGLQANAGCLDFSLRGDGNANQFAQGQTGSDTGTTQDSSSQATTDLSGDAATGVETYYLTPGRVNIHV